MRLELARRSAAAAPSRCRPPTARSPSASSASSTLTDDDGVSGYGEAAPLPAYDGVRRRARARRRSRRYVPVVAPSTTAPAGAQLIEACRAGDDLPQALAAIDLALWDRAGRRAGKPVAALLDRRRRPPRVPVNATLTALDRAGAAEQAAARRRRGLRLPEGQGRRRRRRRTGRRGARRRRPASRAAAGRQRRLGRRGGGALRSRCSPPPASSWSRSPTTASTRCARSASAWRCASRSTRRPPSPARWPRGAADAVCLKISRCGGIGGLLAAAALVRARAPRSTSPRRSTARSASPRRCTPPRRSPRADRCRTAAWRRSRCSTGSRTRCRRAAGRSRCPTGPGLGRSRRAALGRARDSAYGVPLSAEGRVPRPARSVGRGALLDYQREDAASSTVCRPGERSRARPGARAERQAVLGTTRTSARRIAPARSASARNFASRVPRAA